MYYVISLLSFKKVEKYRQHLQLSCAKERGWLSAKKTNIVSDI